MKRLVAELLFLVAERIGATIRKGQFWPTIIGMVLGGVALGTCSFTVAWEFAGPGALLGGLVGALATASLFKAPVLPLGTRATDAEPFRFGRIVRTWTFEAPDIKFQSMTVLLDNALYLVRDDQAPWSAVCAKLEQGEDPEAALGELIRLDELTGINMDSLDATEVQFVHRRAGKQRRRAANFQTIADRDELIHFVEGRMGKKFQMVQHPVDFIHAVAAPLVLVVFVGALILGIAWLSAYWTANPPPPPRGQREPDPLVRLLIWAGWRSILLVGALPFLAALVWIGARVRNPPRLWILELSEREAKATTGS